MKKIANKNNPYLIKEQAFEEGAYSCHGHFWGRSLFMSRTFGGGGSLFMSRTFGGGAYSCQNMPKHAQTNHHPISIASP
jgi:hypothetical protein